jgi:hypothetical protein
MPQPGSGRARESGKDLRRNTPGTSGMIVGTDYTSFPPQVNYPAATRATPEPARP